MISVGPNIFPTSMASAVGNAGVVGTNIAVDTYSLAVPKRIPLVLTTVAASALTACSQRELAFTSVVGLAGLAVLAGLKIFFKRPPPIETILIEFATGNHAPLPTLPVRFQDLSPEQKTLAQALGYGEGDILRTAESNYIKPPGGFVRYVPSSVLLNANDFVQIQHLPENLRSGLYLIREQTNYCGSWVTRHVLFDSQNGLAMIVGSPTPDTAHWESLTPGLLLADRTVSEYRKFFEGQVPEQWIRDWTCLTPLLWNGAHWEEETTYKPEGIIFAALGTQLTPQLEQLRKEMLAKSRLQEEARLADLRLQEALAGVKTLSAAQGPLAIDDGVSGKSR
ncbi:MAG: hypothetical protein Q7T03_08610 [Deltaproteobacteria bacterium]|nr:hypothetical protein [Deltaproteobacteria bacterium]